MSMRNAKVMVFVAIFYILATACWTTACWAADSSVMLHRVKKGETLKKIASMYLSYSAAYTTDELIRDIEEVNGISSSTDIKPGQAIKIPVISDRPISARSVERPRDFIARGVYINRWTAGSRKVFTIVNRITRVGGNTVVFDAKDVTGSLSYASSIPRIFCPDARYRPTIEDMPKLVDFLHLMGIHVVARVCVFKDMLMSDVMPHWSIRRDWINPADPEVQDYIIDILKELASLGVDEIQLDYLRYPSDGQDASLGTSKTRSDVITSFLKRVNHELKPRGVLLSMDVFGIVLWKHSQDITTLGQDIARLAPYLDVISPMLYPSHFADNFSGISNPADRPYLFVSQGILRLKSIVGPNVIIRPWLQAFPLKVTKGFGPGFIQRQIEAASDSGARGWLLWSPGNFYRPAFIAMDKIASKGITKERSEVH